MLDFFQHGQSFILENRNRDNKYNWDEGYATEMMTALIHYYFNTIGLERIIALTKLKNIASKRVIEKIGFKFDHLVSGLPEEFNFYNGEPYYFITKEEYLQKMKNGG